MTDRELRSWRRGGVLTSIRPGAYVRSGGDDLRDAAVRHRLLVRATVPRLDRAAVVSHVSAAVMHGLPVWGISVDRVHVTRDRRSGARRSGVAHLHASALAEEDVTVVDGLAMTSVARTVVDLARAVPFEQAVVIADAGLRAGGADAEGLAAALRRSANRPGVAEARRVVAFADGRSESVGESRSRVAIARAGLPVPVLQHDVYSASGLWLARVDFWWAEHGVVGEFDGRAKYGRLLRPGQEPGDVVFEEKRREDLLRAEHLGVARWYWDELSRFDVVVPRLLRAFGRP